MIVRLAESALTRVVYGVTTTDALALATASALLLVAAIVACVPPALRAMRVDPVEGLRANKPLYPSYQLLNQTVSLASPRHNRRMSLTADVNGLQLFYRDSRQAVSHCLLLHGFTGSGEDWTHVFADPIAGHRVIAPDLRGHGRSTNPSGVFKFADVARDIFALLDRLGIDRVKAIGMSAGANTLLHMATQQPERVTAMIHVSGTPRFPDQARAIMRTMTEEGRSPAEWAEMRGGITSATIRFARSGATRASSPTIAKT